MKSRVIHASFWAIVGGGLQYFMLFGLLAYLTRMLQPRDFGLMATVAIGLDLGLRVARWGQIELLQQPRYRTDSACNHAFRLSLHLATGIALLFIVAAWPIGRAFGSSELTTLFLLCAPVIPLSAASATAEAILRNEFRFQQLAYRNTASTLVAGCVAIVLAARGYGAVALAAQQVVQAALACLWTWSSVAWRPDMTARTVDARAITRDGAGIMVGSLLPQLVPRSFDLYVGVLLGPVALGILRVAYRFNDFVGQMVSIPLLGVASAQFAGFAEDRRALRASYLQLTQASAALTCPLIVGVGLVAPEAVPILFGDNWAASIPVVQIAALLAFATPVNNYFAPAMVALGERRSVIRQGVIDVAFALLLAFFAARISLAAIAVAVIVRATFTSLCNAFELRRAMELPFRDLIRALAPPFSATLVMVAAVTAARYALASGQSPLATLVILSAAGAGAYLTTTALGTWLRFWPDYTATVERLWPKAAAQAFGVPSR